LREFIVDPGYPQSRYRLALIWPGIVTAIAVLGAAVGMVLNRFRNGPAKRDRS